MTACLSIASTLPAFSRQLKPEYLVYMCEDTPPTNYIEGGMLKGASVELLKLIWEKIGCPGQPVRMVPWARGYDDLQYKKKQVLFSMTRTKERAGLFKWAGPISTVKKVLMGLSGRNITIGKIEDAKKYTIGTIRDDVCELFLLDSGFDKNKLESVSGLDQDFEKLRLGRIDLIAFSYSALKDFIRIHNYDPGQFKVYYILFENSRVPWMA